MIWLALALLFYVVAFFLLLHASGRSARAWNAKWDATPAMYRLEELEAWYAEHRELEDAGLLDPDQPTPWTHALHRAATYGNYKDKTQLRMAVDAWKFTR